MIAWDNFVLFPAVKCKQRFLQIGCFYGCPLKKPLCVCTTPDLEKPTESLDQKTSVTTLSYVENRHPFFGHISANVSILKKTELETFLFLSCYVECNNGKYSNIYSLWFDFSRAAILPDFAQSFGKYLESQTVNNNWKPGFSIEHWNILDLLSK